MKKKNIRDLKTDRININTAKRNLGKGFIAESVLEQTIKDEKKESEIQELEDIIRVTSNNQAITEKKDGSLTYRKGGKVNTVSNLQKSYLMDTFLKGKSYENGEEVTEGDGINFGYHDASGKAIDVSSSVLGSEGTGGGYDPQGLYPDINYDPVNNPWHKALSERFQAPPPHLLNFDWQNALIQGGSTIEGGKFNPNHLNILANYAYKNPSDTPRIGGPDLIRYQNQFAGTTTTIGRDGGDRRRITRNLRKKFPSLSNKESKQFYKYLEDQGFDKNITPLGDDVNSSTYRNEYASNYAGATTKDMLTNFRNTKGNKKSIIASQLTNDNTNTTQGPDNYSPITVDPNIMNEEDRAIFESDPSTLDTDGLQRYRELHGHDPNYNPGTDDRLSGGNNNIVDADGDNISDFIDIDGGTGTNKPVEGVNDKIVNNEISKLKNEVNKNLKKVNKKDSLRTIGDKIGLASIVAGGLGQLGTVFASRNSNVTPQNVYKDITKDAESYLKNVIGEIDGLKRNAASQIKSRYSREPDTAMTYQQRRARELSRQTKVDQAVRASNSQYDGMKLGIQGELSKMIAEGDKYSAMGREKQLAQVQANKDNFYTSLGQTFGTLAAAGQKYGQDLNVARQNKEIVDSLKTSGYEVRTGPDGTLQVFYNGENQGNLYNTDGTLNQNIVNPNDKEKGTGGGGPGSKDDNIINLNNITSIDDQNKNRAANKSKGENNVKITSSGKAGISSFVDLEGNEITDINDYDITEDGSLRLNPSGDGYYLDGQKVYGEPNYITKEQYKQITGKDYEGKSNTVPMVMPDSRNKDLNMFDSKVVGKENIGPNDSELNVNASGQAVFESLHDVPAGYDNSDYIVAKDEDGIYWGYERSADGKTWEKQTEESDKIRVYTPFAKDDPLMVSTLERNPNSGIQYGNPYADQSGTGTTEETGVDEVIYSGDENEIIGTNTDEIGDRETTTAGSEIEEVNYKETPEYFRNNKDIDSNAVNKYSLQPNGAIFKDGQAITGVVPNTMGAAKIKGVRVKGTEIIADIKAPMGQGGPKSLGEFVKQGDGYVWRKSENFDKLEGTEKAEMEAFIAAVEHDNKFAAELFEASSSGTAYDISSYNKGGYVTRPVKHPYLSLKIVGKI